ncbi:MAG: hypothetical protein E6R04_10335 [Spirochaetes bacterium]|nr:MAG: hypothetical protein E6R04_10335 [Spirochaetota bacterium]
MSHPLFQRPQHPFVLTDGTRVRLQPLNAREHELALRDSRDEKGLASNALYAAHLALFALVDPKPESLEQVLEIAPDQLYEISEEVAYLSELAERPEAGAPKRDAELVTEETAGGEDAGQLLGEFPGAGDEQGEDLDGDAGDLPGVREAAGGAGAGAAGDDGDDDRGRESASGTQPPGADGET